MHTKGHFAMVVSREKASRDVHLKPFNAENKLLFAEERMTHCSSALMHYLPLVEH